MNRKAKILFFYFDRNNTFHILLGRRISQGEVYWWLPGGSVEEDETDFEAAFRELYEELQPTPSINILMNQYLRAKKDPPQIKYSAHSHNTIFFIRLEEYPGVKDDLPNIKDEFEELRWFDETDLPKNMSRDFGFIHQYVNKTFLENIDSIIYPV